MKNPLLHPQHGMTLSSHVAAELRENPDLAKLMVKQKLTPGRVAIRLFALGAATLIPRKGERRVSDEAIEIDRRTGAERRGHVPRMM